MIRRTVIRAVGYTFVAAVTASFSLTGFIAADTITNTGPNSRNKISSKHKNKCDIDTDNDVSIKNKSEQKAVSGDVSVSDNTVVGEEKDTSSWRDEHEDSSANFTHQMAAHDGSGQGAKEDWTPDADKNEKSKQQAKDSDPENVSTGDAHNSSESRFDVHIRTENECAQKKKKARMQKPSEKEKAKQQAKAKAAAQKAQKAAAAVTPGAGAGAGAGVSQAKPQAQQVKKPAQQAAAPSVSAPKEKGKEISVTGPESFNKISEKVSSNVTATTTNNVNISNSNKQYAETGSANVTHNTSAGAGTGSAANSNDTGAGVGVKTAN